jgi:hypothetical protein
MTKTVTFATHVRMKPFYSHEPPMMIQEKRNNNKTDPVLILSILVGCAICYYLAAHK